MNKRPLIAVVIGIMLASTTALAAPCGSKRDCAPESCQKPRDRMERVVEVLDLNAAQQEQIAAIRSEDQALSAPLRERQAVIRAQLETIIKAYPFDEAAVRSLAAAQATNRTELIVNRARMQSRIHAVLTPEQRVLAEKLRSLRQQDKRPGHHRHGRQEDER